MFHLNRILLDIAAPPQVTKSSIVTDNAGAFPVIIVLAVAAAVAAALILIVLAVRGKRGAAHEEYKEAKQHAV